jgi:hypothetical protein
MLFRPLQPCIIHIINLKYNYFLEESSFAVDNPRRRVERSANAIGSDLFHRQIDRAESPHKSRVDSHTAAKLIERDATRRRRIKHADSQKEAKNRSRRFDFAVKDLKGGEFLANSRTGEAEGGRGQASSQSSMPGKRILQCTTYIVQYFMTKIK